MKKAFKTGISILLIFMFLFTGIVTSAVAEPANTSQETESLSDNNNEDNLDYKSEEEKPSEEEKAQYKFDEETFNKMVDIFVDENFPFKSYNSEILTGNNVMFVDTAEAKIKDPPLYKSGKIMEGMNSVLTNVLGKIGYGIVYRNGYNLIYSEAIGWSSGKQYCKDKYISFDNYGNVLAGNIVILPFFMNPMFMNKDTNIVSSPLTNKEIEAMTYLRTIYPGYENPFYFSPSSKGERRGFFSGKEEEGKINAWVNPTNIPGDFAKIMAEDGKSFNINKKDTKDFIKAKFRDEIMKYNEKYIETALKPENKGKFSNEPPSGVTLADLEEMESLSDVIKGIFKHGFGNLLKLTVAHIVNEIYEEAFINFSGKYIFNTPTIDNSRVFSTVIGFYIIIVILLLSIYLMLSALNIMRGKTTLGEALKRIVLVVIIIFIPVLTYNKIVDLTFNKPVNWIQSNEVNKMMLLDRWALLAKEDIEEEKTYWGSKKRFRGMEYNYLVKINTNTFVDEIHGRNLVENVEQSSTDENIKEMRLSKINKKRACIMTDVNHLIDYAKENTFEDIDKENEWFINYLLEEKSEDYIGLTEEITEYRAYVGEGIVRGENSIRATDLITEVFRYYENEEVSLGDNLYTLSECITGKDLTNSEMGALINQMSFTKNTYDGMFSSSHYSGTEDEKYDKIAELIQQTGGGDILGVEGLVTSIFGENIDNGGYIYLGAKQKSTTVDKMVFEINREIIDDFMEDCYSIRKYVVGESAAEYMYLEAENDIIKLKISLELMKFIKDKNIPTDIEANDIEPDVYFRSLVIPITSITPDNKNIDTAAIFISMTCSLITLLILLTVIFLLIIYGLIKFITISVVLLPAFLILAVIEYIVKDDFSSKLYFGGIYLLGVFAAINAGLILLWKTCSFLMNRQFLDALNVGGTFVFFGPLVNMLMICIYLIIVSKYVIKPTLKTVKDNLGDLGGSVFYDKTMEVVDNMKSKAKGLPLFNQLSGGSDKKLGEVEISEKNKESEVENELIHDREEALRSREEVDNEELTKSEIAYGNNINKTVEERKRKMMGQDGEEINVSTDNIDSGGNIIYSENSSEKGNNTVSSGEMNGAVLKFGSEENAKQASEYLTEKGITNEQQGNVVRTSKPQKEMLVEKSKINEYLLGLDKQKLNTDLQGELDSSGLEEGVHYVKQGLDYIPKNDIAEEIVDKYKNLMENDKNDYVDIFGEDDIGSRRHIISGLDEENMSMISEFFADNDKEYKKELKDMCKDIFSNIKIKGNKVEISTNPEITNKRVEDIFNDIIK